MANYLSMAHWHAVAPLPVGRLNLCVAAAEGSNTLYAVGGYSFPPPDYKASALQYSADGDSWSSVANMSVSRDSFGCGVVEASDGSWLYAVGGESAEYPFILSSVERLNLTAGQSATWAPVASLHEVRQGHAVAVLDGVLYAAGGLSPNSTSFHRTLASVEAYDSKANAWTEMPPMAHARYYHGLAAYGACLYAVGGLSESQEVLASVESYDPRVRRWLELAPLPEPRQRLSLVALLTHHNGGGTNSNEDDGSGIYAMGGCRATAQGGPCGSLLSSVVRLTPSPPPVPAGGAGGDPAGRELGSWVAAPSLPAANVWFGAAAVGGRLFAVGGGMFYASNSTYTLDPRAMPMADRDTGGAGIGNDIHIDK